MAKIPPALIGTAAPALAAAYTHSELDSLFLASGFPGDPPEGNKVHKCQDWLRRANRECSDALERFGRLIGEFMDCDPPEPVSFGWLPDAPAPPDRREGIRKALSQEGLSYQRGGHILGAALMGPSKSLAERLVTEGIGALETEYQRAYAQIEVDPPAAITAACAILESVCKTYLADEGLPLPTKQVLGPLWSEASSSLGLNPKDQADSDLKQILSGLSSIASGVAALRTHEGSAHGRGDTRGGAMRYRLGPRHARLAVHSAHTMALFILETWQARRDAR